MKLRSLAVAVVLALSVLAAPVADAGATGTDVGLSWPSYTQFNPTTTPFVIVAPGDTTGLQVRVNHGPARQVTAEGELVPDFVDQGSQVVTVERCRIVATACSTVEERTVEAYSEFVANPVGGQLIGPGRPIAFEFAMSPVDAAATVTWSVVDPGAGTVLLAGQSEVAAGARRPFTAGPLPAGTPDGTYELRWHVVGDSETYGHLDNGLQPVTVRLDATPDPGRLTLSEKVLYPEHDGYLDRVTITIEKPTGTVPAVEVVAPSGVRQKLYGADALKYRRVTWFPRQALPAGTWTVRLTTTDKAGNVATVDEPLVVRTGHLRWKTWRKTFTAASTVVSKAVGACSTLASPAAGGRKGSLGYYSETRCTRETDSAVSTANGVYLPVSPLGDYVDFRLVVNGGKAAGAKLGYAVVYYWDAKAEEYVERVQLSPRDGKHSAAFVHRTNKIVVDPDGRPRVYWSLGLASGSRYDVTSFTVAIDYQRLL